MELLAGNCRKRVGDDFGEDVDPFDDSGGGCGWMYGGRQSDSPRNDSALATLADLASPPQKLKPIRCGAKPSSSEDRHPLDILAGTLERLPEMGFIGDGCFETPFASKIAEVEQNEQLTRGFTKDDQPLPLQMESEARNSTSWDGLSLSSYDDSEGDSSQGVREAVSGKRKRKTRVNLEHFMEKLVGSMMKRQEKMHNKLIKVMEKMEDERIRREKAWREYEIERTKQNEEARKQEIARNMSIISFIKTVIGEDIEIPKPSDSCQPLQHSIPKPSGSSQPLQNLIPKPSDSSQPLQHRMPKPSDTPQPLQHHPENWEDEKSESAEGQKDIKFSYSSGKRWPQEEVQALIASRGEVEDIPEILKGSIWDEISTRMKEKGYERSAKKCKEKWENINKYYRRVIEAGKKQPEHTKTRSYFQKLENLYKSREKLGLSQERN